MNYRLNITLHTDKDHYPITLSVGVPEELARLIMGQAHTGTTISIEQKPSYISNLPLLDFKGGRS